VTVKCRRVMLTTEYPTVTVKCRRVMLTTEYTTVTVKCRTSVKALYHYFKLCRSVTLYSLSCSFTSISLI